MSDRSEGSAQCQPQSAFCADLISEKSRKCETWRQSSNWRKFSSWISLEKTDFLTVYPLNRASNQNFTSEREQFLDSRQIERDEHQLVSSLEKKKGY